MAIEQTAVCAVWGNECSKLALDFAIQLLTEFAKLAVIATIVGIVLRFTSWRNLVKGRDNKNVSFSVNFINKKGVLCLRPIGKQVSIDELFPDILVANEFRKAVKRNAETPGNPIMEYSSIDYERAINSTLQSWISDDFSKEFLAEAAGHDAKNEEFVFMATYERTNTPLQKVRVIITHMPMIMNRVDPDKVTYEKPHQRHRLSTVEQIGTRYRFLKPEVQRLYWVELPFRVLQS
ncbi:MAG: hypothetical protein GC129_07020 [Proteobacteria bacterium]|nr:hypothetical protein [Pseudomonadota bacterium]